MVHYSGVIFYAIFASGEQQAWANPESTSEDKRGIIGEDELAEESELNSDNTAAPKKSYGTADDSFGRKQGWKKKRGVTMQEEEEEEYLGNGEYQSQYQWEPIRERISYTVTSSASCVPHNGLVSFLFSTTCTIYGHLWTIESEIKMWHMLLMPPQKNRDQTTPGKNSCSSLFNVFFFCRLCNIQKAYSWNVI